MSKKKLQHEDYTVGWICPLEVEQIVALEMLDEEHERLPQQPADRNVYTLGSINGHNVVIAGLPLTGNNPAAAVVAQMRTTFPHIRFGLLVGIGGGVPVKTDNGMVRLGDVVVSKPTGIHSGAVQYDRGKAESGRFKRTGALAPPPSVLLNAAQDLAAQRARSRKDPIAANIERIDTSIRGLRRYKYPGAAADILYKPDYIHLDPKLSCVDCGCDPTQSVPRVVDDDGGDGDGEPYVVVHRGTIASGEAVMKNGFIRDQIANEHGVLCFEMEAAGALSDFSCIVIRGISDYCDSHKNDKWHGYAAAAAAAYARQLFFHMPVDEVRRYISSFAEESIKQLKQNHDEREHLQKRKALFEWLSPFDSARQQSDFLSRRYEGTGSWLLSSAEYLGWVEQQTQTMFCPGIPGAGKTIMSSIVVDSLENHFSHADDIAIAYIYCSYQPQQEQRPEDLLSSLLKQLVHRRAEIMPEIQRIYDRYMQNGSRPSIDDIAATLSSAVRLYSKVFIVIDALDEYYISNYQGLREILSRIFALQGQGAVSLFATSRHVHEISSQFGDATRKEIRANNDDLFHYIDGLIPKLLRSNMSKHPPDLKNTIRGEIVKAADGMFLLARLHMESLMSCLTLGDLKRSLRNLPKKLDGTYEQAVKRIEAQDEGCRGPARNLLSWITYAKRALGIKEVQHALAVGSNMDMTELDEDFLLDVDILTSICAGLVTVDQECKTIQLVHYTTQEYFVRTSEFQNEKWGIAATCVTYLSLDAFDSGFCPSDEEFNKRLLLYPLYGYAAKNWGYHVFDASETGLGNKLVKFLGNDAKVSSCSQAFLDSELHRRYDYSGLRTKDVLTGVHLAAYFGLSGSVAALLRDGHDADPISSENRTPLSWAAERGHSAVVEILLEEKPDLEFRDASLHARTPLLWAVCNGYTRIAELLVESGADIECKDENYGLTPLSWAAANGHIEIVKLLLNKGAEVDSGWEGGDDQDQSMSPLAWASLYGHEAVVKLLLQKDANTEVIDYYDSTPLSFAIEKKYGGIIELLLAKGAKVNYRYFRPCDIQGILDLSKRSLPDPWRQRLMPYTRGSIGKTKTIPEGAPRGFLVNRKIHPGQNTTPLSHASSEGYVKAVQLLLDNGADLNLTDIYSGSASLCWAANAGQEATVRILLDRGANPHATNYQNKTPLHYAEKNKHEKVADLLRSVMNTNTNHPLKDTIST